MRGFLKRWRPTRIGLITGFCILALLLSSTPAFVAPVGQMIGRLTVITDPYPKYSGTPVESDLLTIIRAEDLSVSLSPVTLNMYSPFTFVYDPLIWIEEYTLEPKPWLAASWELASDQKTYTFKLRNDVKWHDGSPLTAEDVAWSFIAYRDDPESGVARFFVQMKEDPVVVDPLTMRVTLDAPSADFIANAGNQFIMQKKQFEKYWAEKKTLETFDYEKEMLIGTGQWKQVKYSKADNYIEYVRNDAYWHQKPHFKRMVFRHNQNAAARLLAWKNGETDLLWPITATDIDQVSDREGKLYSAYAVAYMWAAFNFKNPKQPVQGLFDDKRVRHALSMAINREGYADAIFKGFVDETKIGSVAFPWAYNDKLTNAKYDPEGAKALLAQAGWTINPSTGKLTNARGQPMILNAIMTIQQGYPVDKIMEVVQENFRQIGIDLTLERLESATYRKRWREDFDFDFLARTRILFGGFNDYSYYHSTWDPRTNKQGLNYGGWSNPDADRLLDQIIREPDLAKQKALLDRFQEILNDDLPALWFGFPRDLILVQKDIEGYQPNAMWQYWNTWSLWRTK